MIKQKITNQPVNFKMDKIPHKHRKGFREDAQLLGEAYDNVVNEALPGLIAGGIMGGKAAAKTGLFKKSTGVMTGAAIGDSITGKGGSGESQTTTTYTSDEEGELSDDYTNPNYRGDPHDFQPGEIIEVGPWGPNDEADHLEVVLQVKGDVINTVPIADDAYGVQYGGRGGADISLIRPQSELELDSQEQFTPMEFPSDEEY